MDDSWLEIGIFSFAPFLRSVQDFLDFVRGQPQPPLELPPELASGLVSKLASGLASELASKCVGV